MKTKALFLISMLIFAISSYGQSGQVGDISWNITNGVLTISGSGPMGNIPFNSQWKTENYRSLFKKIVIEYGITSIGNHAFYDCKAFTSIEIPNSVTSIQDNAFNSCYELINIRIPNSVTSIGVCVFENCINLTSIEIPNSVTSIGQDAFNGCNELKNIELPNNITVIGNRTFEGCRSLVNIKIPKNITSMGDCAFNMCNDLSTVDVYWENPISMPSYMISNGVFDNVDGAINLTLVVPSGTKSVYENAYVWQGFKTIIERVSVPVTSVSLFLNNSANIVAGSSLQLTATVSPANATDKSLTWKSSNETVATVDSSGKLTALSSGSAKITVSTNNEGKTASLDVTVFEIPATSISLDIEGDSLQIGDTLQLTAMVAPSFSKITWSSSNDSVATIDSDGRVIGISEGVTTAMAKTSNGLLDTCTITVYKVVNNIEIELPLESGGSIDFAIELPVLKFPVAENITRSFVLKLPEGSVIDVNRANLTESQSTGLELTITPLGNNSWMIEITNP